MTTLTFERTEPQVHLDGDIAVSLSDLTEWAHTMDETVLMVNEHRGVDVLSLNARTYFDINRNVLVCKITHVAGEKTYRAELDVRGNHGITMDGTNIFKLNVLDSNGIVVQEILVQTDTEYPEYVGEDIRNGLFDALDVLFR